MTYARRRHGREGAPALSVTGLGEVVEPRPKPEKVCASAPPRVERARRCSAMSLGLVLLVGCAAIVGSPEGARCERPGTITYAAVDVSGSARRRAILEGHLDVVRAAARRAGACGGHLRVAAFSSSIAASAVLFDAVLAPEGATDIARSRRLPGVVDDAMRAIESNLSGALDALPAHGTDVSAQLTHAAEIWDQLGRSRPLDVYVLTDGVATAGVDLHRALRPAAAKKLALRPSVPKLHGARVTFAGIGRHAGAPNASSFVEVLKTYWRIVCRRTGATCRVVTDFASGA